MLCAVVVSASRWDLRGGHHKTWKRPGIQKETARRKSTRRAVSVSSRSDRIRTCDLNTPSANCGEQETACFKEFLHSIRFCDFVQSLSKPYSPWHFEVAKTVVDSVVATFGVAAKSGRQNGTPNRAGYRLAGIIPFARPAIGTRVDGSMGQIVPSIKSPKGGVRISFAYVCERIHQAPTGSVWPAIA
jgi:hypothetical protein